MSCVFRLLCVPRNLWLDTRHCEFYFVGCWIFFLPPPGDAKLSSRIFSFSRGICLSFFFFFIILLGIYHVNLGSLSLKYLYKTSSAYCSNNLEGRKEKYFPSTLLSFLAGTLKWKIYYQDKDRHIYLVEVLHKYLHKEKMTQRHGEIWAFLG